MAKRARPVRKSSRTGRAQPFSASAKRAAATRIAAERAADRARAAAAERARVDKLPTQRWMRALERMRSHLSIHREATLRARGGEGGTRWALVGKISGWDGTLSYGDLWTGLAEVDQDAEITKLIGARRIARLSVMYEGPAERGGARVVTREWVLAEIAPWSVVIARALERLDPGIEDSITARYSDGPVRTRVVALAVWISHEVAGDVEI